MSVDTHRVTDVPEPYEAAALAEAATRDPRPWGGAVVLRGTRQ